MASPNCEKGGGSLAIRAPPPVTLAALAPRASPPREPDQEREATAGGDGSGNFPPVTRRRVRDCSGASMRNTPDRGQNSAFKQKISVRKRTCAARAECARTCAATNK